MKVWIQRNRGQIPVVPNTASPASAHALQAAMNGPAEVKPSATVSAAGACRVPGAWVVVSTCCYRHFETLKTRRERVMSRHGRYVRGFGQEAVQQATREVADACTGGARSVQQRRSDRQPVAGDSRCGGRYNHDAHFYRGALIFHPNTCVIAGKGRRFFRLSGVTRTGDVPSSSFTPGGCSGSAPGSG